GDAAVRHAIDGVDRGQGRVAGAADLLCGAPGAVLLAGHERGVLGRADVIAPAHRARARSSAGERANARIGNGPGQIDRVLPRARYLAGNETVELMRPADVKAGSRAVPSRAA